MTRFALPLTLASLLGALSAPSLAALNPGDTAPDFTAPAALAGKEFSYSLKAALQHGPVVVYFYPSAFTGGCNIQAHTFALNQDRFTAAGASIVGVSLDSIGRLDDFSADPNYCAGKIPVASDPGGAIARSYALSIRDAVPGKKDTRGQEIDHGFAERTTFVIGPQGKIAAVLGGLAPAENVERTLQVVQTLR
ncbi:MAG: peroxiredoxin [Nevskia sp.]|nr:peroxiredoxin [Nevskia sp.]